MTRSHSRPNRPPTAGTRCSPNLDPAEADPPGVLLRFKGQEASERRYGNYKGPLAVAPMFLQHNRRIAALITVICLALLVFSVVERQVRAQIAPAAKIPGLYADRPARPTGWLIFAAMAGLRLIPAAADRPAVIRGPRHCSSDCWTCSTSTR